MKNGKCLIIVVLLIYINCLYASCLGFGLTGASSKTKYYKSGVTKNIKYKNREKNKVEYEFNENGELILFREYLPDSEVLEFLFKNGRIKKYYDVNNKLDISLYVDEDNNPVDAYLLNVYKKDKVNK